MNLLELKNVSKSFSENYTLQNFSYIISEGDKIIISGRSGIGKTTLFKLLLGFEQPDAGSILFRSTKYDEENIWQVRKEIAYVPQNLNIGNGNVMQLFDSSIAISTKQKNRKTDQKKLNELLIYFELERNVLEKNLETLSGGEKQRIAIINAILLERKIYLLDEISSALDKKLKTKTIDYFFRNKDYTVLAISHDGYVPDYIEVKTIAL